MIIFALIILGLCFGSFVNALVWRVYQQSLPAKKQTASDKELSILTGRSMCPHCKHTLAWYDLLPVVSWVSLLGRCRYCRQTISVQYPLVELLTAGLFVLSWILWPDSSSQLFSVVSLTVWLGAVVCFVALVIYDLKWMLLPNRIVFPLMAFGLVTAVITLINSSNIASTILNMLVAVAVAGGLFYVLFQVSGGTWIGGGDVKLGFAIGLLLGTPVLAFVMLFLASILGLVASIPAMLSRKKGLSGQIPFGPFLIVATITVKLIGIPIIGWYTRQFLFM